MSSIRKGVTLSVAGLSLAQVDVVSSVASEAKGLSIICAGHMSVDGEFIEHGPGKVNQIYRCAQCEAEGTISEFPLRGAVKGSVVTMFTEEQVASMDAPDDLKLGMSVNIHKADEVESMLPTGTSYFLTCPASQMNAYRLVVETISRRPDLALVTTWAARSKAALYQLIVRDNALMMRQLAWPADRKEVPVIDGSADEKQLNLLGQLLDGSVEEFDVNEYVDNSKSIAEQVMASTEAVPMAGSTVSSKQAETPVALDLTISLERMLEMKLKPARKTTTRKVKVNA